MIGVLVQFCELDVVVQEEDLSEGLGVVDIDRLKVGLAMQDVLPNFDIDAQLVAADGIVEDRFGHRFQEDTGPGGPLVGSQT